MWRTNSAAMPSPVGLPLDVLLLAQSDEADVLTVEYELESRSSKGSSRRKSSSSSFTTTLPLTDYLECFGERLHSAPLLRVLNCESGEVVWEVPEKDTPSRRKSSAAEDYLSGSMNCRGLSVLSSVSAAAWTESTVDDLPDELWITIFSLLDAHDLSRLSQVCTEFKRLTSDEGLWRSLFELTWGEGVCSHKSGGNREGTLTPNRISWCAAYARKYHLEGNWSSNRCWRSSMNTGAPIQCWGNDHSKVICAGTDGAIRVLDYSGRRIRAMYGHSALVSHVIFDDRCIVTSSRDGTCRVWDMDELQCVRVLRPGGIECTVDCMSLFGKRVVSGGSDGKVTIFDIFDGSISSTLLSRNSIMTSVHLRGDISSKGRCKCGHGLAVCAGDTDIEVWDPIMKSVTDRLNISEYGTCRSITVIEGGALRGSVGPVVLAACETKCFAWDIGSDSIIRTFAHGTDTSVSMVCCVRGGGIDKPSPKVLLATAAGLVVWDWNQECHLFTEPTSARIQYLSAYDGRVMYATENDAHLMMQDYSCSPGEEVSPEDRQCITPSSGRKQPKKDRKQRSRIEGSLSRNTHDMTPRARSGGGRRR